MLELILHTLIVLPLFISSLPIKINYKYLQYAQIFGHGLEGILFIFIPSYLLSWTIEGEFKELHSFIQSFIGIFHISISISLFYHQSSKQGRSFIFARIITSFFILFTRLFAAIHLSEKSTRGLLMSNHFITSSLILDGVWMISEVIRFIYENETTEERIHYLCTETTRWAEGRGSKYLETCLYIDSFICFIYAFIHFAFPQNILKLIIKPNLDLDSHHYMWCRIFGVLYLLPSLSSLSSIHSPFNQQITHLLSRLITQIGLFILDIYGHWIIGVFSPNHITAFMVAGFFMSFHISTFYRFKKIYVTEPRSKVSAKVEIKKIK